MKVWKMKVTFLDDDKLTGSPFSISNLADHDLVHKNRNIFLKINENMGLYSVIF